MWTRAVWMEGKREIEGVIPNNWIQGDAVKWPPGNNAKKAMDELRTPTEKWRKFKLVKKKLTSGMGSQKNIL